MNNNVPSILCDDLGLAYSFGELLEVKGWTVSQFARAVGVSRQCVYKYINGWIKPERIPYNVVTDWCQYLGVGDMQLYNAMVTSYEGV